MRSKRYPKYVVLLACVSLCQLAGVIGSIFTAPEIPTWYTTLNKPFFNPPAWVFGPVWTTLYTLMGIWLYRFIQLLPKSEPRNLVKQFLIHIVVNTSWSIIFFGFKNLGLAFVVIVGMWTQIIYLIFKSKNLDFKASLLLIPYFLWVSFATVLNLALWYLN